MSYEQMRIEGVDWDQHEVNPMILLDEDALDLHIETAHENMRQESFEYEKGLRERYRRFGSVVFRPHPGRQQAINEYWARMRARNE